jgi:hypothetical protein
MYKILLLVFFSNLAFAQNRMFQSQNGVAKTEPLKKIEIGNSVLLIPKGNYTAVSTSGTFPFNPVLGGGNVAFTGQETFSGSSSWGPQQLFDNTRTNFDWCSNGPTQFGQFVFPKPVTIKKIFVVPRSQNDNFPTQAILIVDGVTIGTFTPKNIATSDGLQINYSGNGFLIEANVTGTTWRLEFSGPGAVYIGELEFLGS